MSVANEEASIEGQDDLVYTTCTVCGAKAVTGYGGYSLCTEHLFSKIIWAEEVGNGTRFTAKKSAGETIL